MKHVSIPIDDLITVLEAMRESGSTTHVVFTEYEGWPALCDRDEPENIIMFKGEEEEGSDEGSMH
jgi:hypothetical protein